MVLFLLIVMEVTSWMASQGSGSSCLVDVKSYGAYYEQNNQCPTFHVFVIGTVSSALESLGHEWLIAVAAMATAFFTGTLWWSNSGNVASDKRDHSVGSR